MNLRLVASPPKHRPSRFKAIRGLGADAAKAYDEIIHEMINEIIELVDGRPIAKSGAAAGTVHTWADGEQFQKQPSGEWTPVVGQRFSIRAPEKIAGGMQRDYEVAAVNGGNVRLVNQGYQSGPSMPTASVRHFVNDLHGKIEAPQTARTEINAVINGQAELLGKGDDGIAFRVGDKVVKVSTTVPYQPENPGHRSPDEAARMLEQQSANANAMIAEGVPGILPSEFVRSGDKGFEIKDYVQIPDQLSPDQLEAVHDTLQAMHDRGWVLGDTPQVGIDGTGRVLMFDVGKAHKDSSKAGRELDKNALEHLYHENGGTYLPRGDALEENWQLVFDTAKLKRLAKMPPIARMVRRKIETARDGKIAEARRQWSGKDLETELEMINEDAEPALKLLDGGEK